MKFSRVVIATLCVALLVPAGIAFGQAITQYGGSIQVQNLEGSEAAVVVTFYPQTGTEQSFNYTIPANGGLKLFPLPVTGSFNGSAVISSDRQLYAVSTLTGDTATNQLFYNGVYEGFSGGASTVNFPLMQANNANNFAWFNIQNVGSSTATANISFLPRDANMGSHFIGGISVEANRAKTFKLSDYAAQLYGTAGRFVGSVVVTSTNGTLAGVAIQENTVSDVGMLAYGGFLGTAGSTTVVAPLLQFRNANIFSSVNVQNVGTSAATITATFTAPVCPGCTFTPAQEVRTGIAPGKIATFNLLPGGQWVDDAAHRWVGGASFTSNGQPLVAVATILSRSPGPKSASFYSASDPTSATNKAVMPLLQFDNGQTYSSATVYNLGPNAINVTLTYGPNTCGASCTFAPVPESATVASGSSYNFRLLEGATPQWTSSFAQQKRYVGSGSVTLNSGTGPFVVVVNQQRLATWGRPLPAGDTIVTYGALDVTP